MGTKQCTAIYLSILLTLLPLTNQLECKPPFNVTCGCSKSLQNDNLDLYCPTFTAPQASVKYTLDRVMEITCSSNTSFDGITHNYAEPIENYNFLPKFNASVDEFIIVDCPLKNETMNDFLMLINVNNITKLNMQYNKDVLLKSDYFKSISHTLMELTIVKSDIGSFNPDLFEGMDKLTMLDLNTNQVALVDNQFKALIKLTELDLSRNNMFRLPKYAFRNLEMLRKLHLWSNRISELHEDVFLDLINLLSLELSRNEISHLPENVFSSMTKLSKINLGNNNLTSIPAGIFKNNKLLTSIRLEGNKLYSLPDAFFAGFHSLENISLHSCSIKELPEDLFKDSRNIRDLNFQRNMISSIPNQLLDGLNKLQTLYLDHNQLTYISDDIFKNNIALLELRLDYNLIRQNISGKLLSHAQQLKIFNINNNEIEAVDLFAFNKNENLIKIDLSNNKIVLDDSKSGVGPFNNCPKLEYLNLRNNSISFMLTLYTNLALNMLDLSYNKITYVDFPNLLTLSDQATKINLSNNLITEVNMDTAEALVNDANDRKYDARSYSDISSHKVYLNNNPIVCDCHAYNLLRYFNLTINPVVRSLVEIIADELYCAQPPNFANISVQSVRPTIVTCDVSDCPEDCDCAYRPHKSTYIIDCSGRNLSQVPIVNNANFTYKTIEMYLQDNLLTEISMEDKLIALNMSNNLLRNISSIPKNLEVLNLDNNHIQRLDDNILSKLNMTITLHDNPWMCDCAAANLSHFIRDQTIMYKNKIRCNGNGVQLKQLTNSDLCPTSTILILYIMITAVLIISLIAVSSALYYKYNKEIKVWMYAHNICLALVSEEDLDKDKKYDAFLSYSHVDENFVIEELVTKLESGPYPYKLCLHTRNWIPGEFIATQVTDSVLDSRRTIVVLSRNFLDSIWGKMEFREAHTQALSEKRTRVIVILYGDIDPDSDIIDDEMKLYLKTNTYIKWGDPWFWDKLRYALPHNHKKGKKKFENISVNLDKMDLINGNLTPNVTSTPPAHPLLLKGNPLDFKVAENRNTPPAEAGFDLVITTTN